MQKLAHTARRTCDHALKPAPQEERFLNGETRSPCPLPNFPCFHHVSQIPLSFLSTNTTAEWTAIDPRLLEPQTALASAAVGPTGRPGACPDQILVLEPLLLLPEPELHAPGGADLPPRCFLLRLVGAAPAREAPGRAALRTQRNRAQPGPHAGSVLTRHAVCPAQGQAPGS